MNKKISTPLAILIILLVIAVIIGVALWICPEKETIPPLYETDDWETYRNEEYGFEVKYPVGFTASSTGPNYFQQELDKGEQISGTVPPAFDVIIFSDKVGNQFSIEIYHTPFNKLNQDYVYGGECGSQFADENLINQVVNLNGKDFLERSQVFSDNKIRIDYCFISGTNNLITLRAENLNSIEVARINSLFNQILSTFKFLDETADWQTYRNEEYRFEFKYPPIPSGCENCKINESNEGFDVNRTFLSISDIGELNLSEYVYKEFPRELEEGPKYGTTTDGGQYLKETFVESRKNITVGGQEAITIDYRFGGMGRSGTATFVKKDNKVITLEFTAGAFCCDSSTDTIYETEVYGAMLSTLKFLD